MENTYISMDEEIHIVLDLHPTKKTVLKPVNNTQNKDHPHFQNEEKKLLRSMHYKRSWLVINQV